MGYRKEETNEENAIDIAGPFEVQKQEIDSIDSKMCYPEAKYLRASTKKLSNFFNGTSRSTEYDKGIRKGNKHRRKNIETKKNALFWKMRENTKLQSSCF